MRLLLALLLFPLWAAAATWYVRPISGEYGAEDGTSYATAFDGIADMAGSYASIEAGDTVCYDGDFPAAEAQGGTTYLHYFNDSGSAGNPITLDGDCDGDGVRASIDAGGTIQRVMQIADNNNLTIKNLELRNGTARGLLLYNVATDATDRGAIVVDNVYVHDITGAAVANGIDSRGIGVTVKNSTVEDIGEDGIYHKGANFTATDNVIQRVSSAGALGDCLQLDGNYAGFVIRGNYCDHTNSATKQCFIASGPTDSGAGLVAENTCLRPSGEGTNATYGYYFEAASATTTIRRNFYRGGRTAFQVLGAGAFDVESNIAIVQDSDLATAARCISIGASAGQTDASNNSCSGGYEGIVSSSSAAAQIRNNVVSNVTNDCINKAAGDSESRNKCSNYGGDLVSNNGTATTAGTGTENAAPQWLGGTNPTTAEGFIPLNTALRASGTVVGDIRDFYGTMFQTPPSIGAFELRGPRMRIDRSPR